jgi:hypothetical protein
VGVRGSVMNSPKENQRRSSSSVIELKDIEQIKAERARTVAYWDRININFKPLPALGYVYADKESK